MKPREKTGPADAMTAPPPALRVFTDPSRADGRGPGMDAYPDRAAWLKARTEWAAEHGKTVSQWWNDLMDEHLKDMHEGRCTLAEAGNIFRFAVEEDDWIDPRLTDPLML